MEPKIQNFSTQSYAIFRTSTTLGLEAPTSRDSRL
jgi:hypothetical protein